MAASGALCADDVNFMVYRYLQESGFQHSAFSFGYESAVHKASINAADVPPGALVSFVQKGLQYLELEANLTEEGTEVDTGFSLLTAHDLLSKDIDELKALVSARRELEAKREKERSKAAREKERPAAVKPEKRAGEAVPAAPVPMEEDAALASQVPAEEVTQLLGHSGEVFACTWSPSGAVLASGSGDGTARIWAIPPGPSGEAAKAALREPLVLRHEPGGAGEGRGEASGAAEPGEGAQGKTRLQTDVSTLDWSADGLRLATGSYDWVGRLWDAGGALQLRLVGHRGPIFAIRWNRRGDLVLTGSTDKTVIVWDAATGAMRQQFAFHASPTLDVDWKNNTMFASCGADGKVFVCRVGDAEKTREFSGHSADVNAVRWDPSTTLLASCSDDGTAKVWSLKQEGPLVDLRLHTKEIYSIKWSPTGPGSNTPARPLVLATASFDATVRLWDPVTGACLACLAQHSEPVYSVAFSPDGEFLASGSLDCWLHVWAVNGGALVRSYKGGGGIFDVSWNREGDRLAACLQDNSLCVVDARGGR